MFPVIPHVFASRPELEDYVEYGLNMNGHNPVQSVVDQNGEHWLASRAAPGGDGYDFYFVLLDGDSGYVHECNGEETGCTTLKCSILHSIDRDEFGPSFPVLAWIRQGITLQEP